MIKIITPPKNTSISKKKNQEILSLNTSNLIISLIVIKINLNIIGWEKKNIDWININIKKKKILIILKNNLKTFSKIFTLLRLISNYESDGQYEHIL